MVIVHFYFQCTWVTMNNISAGVGLTPCLVVAVQPCMEWILVKKRCKVWKEWNEGNTVTQKYLEVKKKIGMAVY